MKAAVMMSPGVLQVTQVQEPTCPRGGALLKVLACAVCGTDIKMLEKGHRDLTYPRIPGHEVVAEVVEADTPHLTVGDRVQVWPGSSCGRCRHCLSGNDHLCPEVRIMGFNMDGGMAELIAVEDLSRLNLIGHADASLMTLAEPLACCINAQEKLGVGKGDHVLILGGGPLGCLNAFLSKHMGAATVTVSEPLPDRLRPVPKGLIDRIASPDTGSLTKATEEVSGGQGMDVIIPCTPQVRLDEGIFRLLSHRGRLCVFSGPDRVDSVVPVDLREIHYRELTVVGSYGNASRHCREAVGLLKKADISWIITGRFGSNDIERAFDHASARKGQKAVVRF